LTSGLISAAYHVDGNAVGNTAIRIDIAFDIVRRLNWVSGLIQTIAEAADSSISNPLR